MMRSHALNARPIPILTYHQIAQAPAKGAPFRSLCVSPAAFSRQMAFLALFGYRGLSMTALAPYLSGAQSGKVVGITFDDGYLNNLTHALPILNRHGFSSTCYAISQKLGQTNDWDQALGVAQTRLMNANELCQWVAGGQEVGAHTRHHVRLNQVDPAVSFTEITHCRHELERDSQSPVQHFCYPYGDYAESHVDMVESAGFLSATTTSRGRCQAGDELMQLPRVPVVRSTNLFQFWMKIATTYEDRRRS